MNHTQIITAILSLIGFADAPETPRQAVKVIGVSDGDTGMILEHQERVRVRLEGIDAPESGQPFSTKAKERLSELLDSGDVTAKFIGTDRYGRKLACLFVTTPRCTLNINEALVNEGMAWHYKAFSDDRALAELETIARSEQRSLWSDATPVAPWNFRKQPVESR